MSKKLKAKGEIFREEQRDEKAGMPVYGKGKGLGADADGDF